jgi:hypothetical protein
VVDEIEGTTSSRFLASSYLVALCDHGKRREEEIEIDYLYVEELTNIIYREFRV